MAWNVNTALEAFDGIVDLTTVATGIKTIRAMRGMAGARPVAGAAPQNVPGPTSNAFGIGKVDEGRFGRALFMLKNDELENILKLFEELQKHQLKQLRITFTAVPDTFMSTTTDNPGKKQQGEAKPKATPISHDVEVLKGIAASVANPQVGVKGTIRLMMASGMITLTTVEQDLRKKVVAFFGLEPGKSYTLKEFDRIATRKIGELPRVPRAKTKGPETGFLGSIKNWLAGF